MKNLFDQLSIHQRMVLNIAVIFTGMAVMLFLLFYQSSTTDKLTTQVTLAEKLNVSMLTITS
jgi:hypothetical protein